MVTIEAILLLLAGLIAGLLLMAWMLSHHRPTQNHDSLNHARGRLDTVMYSLSEASPMAIFICDAEGNICDWFESASVLFGWERVEAIGQNISILVPEELIAEHLEAFQELVHGSHEPETRTETAMRVFEGSALNRDGTELPVRITLRGWFSQRVLFFSAEVKLR